MNNLKRFGHLRKTDVEWMQPFNRRANSINSSYWANSQYFSREKRNSKTLDKNNGVKGTWHLDDAVADTDYAADEINRKFRYDD